jgi:hypothetical protein
MHIFSRSTLDRFLVRVGDLYKVRWSDDPSLTLTRADLPKDPEVRVLPGR